MPDTFTPTLTTTDWNEEWKALQTARAHPDNAAEWDERSKTFHTAHGTHSTYSNAFMQLAGVQPGEIVFDMGCGTGALAIPYAAAGNPVLACDFSRGMLDVLEQTASEDGLDNIQTIQMSWADDWAAHGVRENCADVAIASRSIATCDLKDSLLKLTAVARRRACITLPCGASPRTDEKLMGALGLKNQVGRDFAYAVNILIHEGFYPEVNYIPSRRKETFETFEDARVYFEKVVRQATKTLDSTDVEPAIERITPWLESNLVESDEGLRLAEERVVTWAFIAWNK